MNKQEIETIISKVITQAILHGQGKIEKYKVEQALEAAIIALSATTPSIDPENPKPEEDWIDKVTAKVPGEGRGFIYIQDIYNENDEDYVEFWVTEENRGETLTKEQFIKLYCPWE
jgi:hypothetical protein